MWLLKKRIKQTEILETKFRAIRFAARGTRAVVTDLCRRLTYNSWGLHTVMIRGEHGIHCMPCSFRIIIEVLPEIDTKGKCDYLESMVHSQIQSTLVISTSVISKRKSDPCFNIEI